MKVKAGYKQTEFGVIPETWRTVVLSDLLAAGPKNGYSGRSGKDARGTPTLSLGATTTGRLVLNEETVKRLHETVGADSELFLKPGDVLVQRSNTPELVGTTAVFDGPDGEYVYPDLMMRMRFRRSETAHWFWRYANSASGRRFFASVAAGSSGSMPKISGERLRKMSLPLPTNPEQSAITTALSDVDALLVGLDQLIAKKRDLKQAAMQQLLSGKTRLPGYHGEWIVERLGQLASFSKGTQLPSSEVDEGGTFAHLNGGITPSGYTHRSNTAGNTIAISEGGNSCGFVQFMSEPYWCGGHCYCVVPSSIDNRFLYHSLKGQQPAIMALRVGSGLPNVQKPALLAFRLRIPADRQEQTAIAEVLTDMDAELQTLEARLNKTRDLKQALMQELLTGRTRLI